MSIARHPLIMFGTKPAAASSFLLDTYTGAIAAVSLRQLKTGETTPARITNSSGSTEADYTVSDIDGGLTAIGSNTGTIAKLYDHANANDLQQTVLASQMVIKNAGTMQTLNGKPAMNNTADFGVKTAGNVTFSANTEYWLFFVMQTPVTQSPGIIFESSPNHNLNPGSMIIYYNNATQMAMGSGGGNKGLLSVSNDGNQKLMTFRIKGGAVPQAWINGIEQTLTDTFSFPATFNDYTLNLFARDGSSLRYNGRAQEAIIFGGDQSANRAGIEANINAYYGIY